MKNNNGFIAVSIIFSFFIVFLMLLTINITNLAQNRILMNQVKKDIKNTLGITINTPVSNDFTCYIDYNDSAKKLTIYPQSNSNVTYTYSWVDNPSITTGIRIISEYKTYEAYVTNPEGKKAYCSITAKKQENSNNILCKRATTLHTETCTAKNQVYSTYFCNNAGYTTGSTITYGNETVTNGTLTSGDAFDCDVNGDEVYDPETERFYYISEYYNTTTKTFDNSTAVLIYYSNVKNNMIDNKSKYYYNSNNYNYQGPVTAIEQLPTTSQWSNVSFKNIERAILNEEGWAKTTGGPLPTSFSYSGYAARLLTYQEVINACGTKPEIINNWLDNCQYLLENTTYSSGDPRAIINGYWLETPRSSNSSTVWYVNGERALFSHAAGNYISEVIFGIGIRPVIDVPITNIEY